jgi:hypothetical protein
MDLKTFLKSKKLCFSKRVEFNPRGLTRYITNASESYGIELDPEKIVFILDDTVFGSGNDGCIVAVTGIMFKSIFQRPVSFSLDKISDLEVIGRKVIINGGKFSHDFSIIEEADISVVFDSVRQWLNYRDEFNLDADEYSEKLKLVKDFLKSLIIPLAMAMIEKMKDESKQEEMNEHIENCIDDIKDLEHLISNGNTTFFHAQYIDDLIELLTATNAFFTEGKEFNKDILKSKAYDRVFGHFLKGFLNGFLTPIIEELEKKTRKSKLKAKIENF